MEIQGYVGGFLRQGRILADMKHPYVTYDNTFIESEWWALKQIWDKACSIRASR